MDEPWWLGTLSGDAPVSPRRMLRGVHTRDIFQTPESFERDARTDERGMAYLGQDFALMNLCLGLALLSQRRRECIRMRASDDLYVLVRCDRVTSWCASTIDETYRRRAPRDHIVRK
jgi:hypothetical protein